MLPSLSLRTESSASPTSPTTWIPIVAITTVGVVVLISASATWIRQRWTGSASLLAKSKDNHSGNKKSRSRMTMTRSQEQEHQSKAEGVVDETVDVWAARRQRGVVVANHPTSNSPATSGSSSSSSFKPFGSSYYYAHNNVAAKGGYKDGLRMEDYTMNQPRLLSRGGKAIVDVSTEHEVATKTNENFEDDNLGSAEKAQNITMEDPSYATATATTTASEMAVGSLSSLKKPSLPVTRYLWDDEGKSNGMATIRIDHLPAPTGNEMIPIHQVAITQVDAKLTTAEKKGCLSGLRVEMETASTVNYRLHIPVLYGKVSRVESMIKGSGGKKRILVHLHKTVGWMDRSKATKAWPHPQKKHL